MFDVGGVPPTVGGDNLAAAATAHVPSGTYLYEARPSGPSVESQDPQLQARLVEDTARRLAISLP